MQMKNKYYLFSFLLFIINLSSIAQTDSSDIYDYSFSQLSKLKITSASKTPQSIGELSSSIYIISALEIKERGYFTLEEALSALPGFQFRNIQGMNSYVFQRGLPSQNNLILLLMDGVQVNELNSGGFYGGGQYNLSNVERIEVVFGPASVAYGTNAVSGIINIITKGELENHIEANTLIGSYNTISSDFSYCRANEKKSIGIRVSGMVKKSDKANLKGSAGDYNWTDLMDNFENDYSLDLKVKAGSFTLGTNYLQKQSSTATLFRSTGTLYRDYGTSWNIQFINSYLKYSKNLTDKLALSSTLYNRNATVLDNTIYLVVDTAQIGYYRPNNLTGFENVISYKVNQYLSFNGGLSLEYEQLSQKNTSSFSSSPEVKPPTPQKPTMDKNNLLSIFMEPRLTLFKSLFLSVGMRFDQSSIYDQVFTPHAGLSYNLRKQIIRFSYAEAFRAPKPWDYTDGIGNSSLLPEKMKSMEAALTLSFNDNIKLDIVGYKNTLSNAITKDIISTDEYKWINKGEVNTDGLDIYFRYSSQKINSSFGYTLNKSVDEMGKSIPEISKYSGNAIITYSISNHFKFNLQANYIGERENPKVIVTTNSRYVNPSLVFHCAISLLNYNGFSLQLSAKNILNTDYYHTSNRTPDRYRQPQRTIMLSVGYSFKK
ncbi:MAG: TonB-dependent receptor [Bacteroidales bacterium]|nr:MAG: TonB-dependent receptor [Bacteroidales bacterium]